MLFVFTVLAVSLVLVWVWGALIFVANVDDVGADALSVAKLVTVAASLATFVCALTFGACVDAAERRVKRTRGRVRVSESVVWHRSPRRFSSRSPPPSVQVRVFA